MIKDLNQGLLISFFTTVVGIITNIVLAREFGPVFISEYSKIVAWLSILTYIITLGVDQGGLGYITAKGVNPSAFAFSSLTYSLCIWVFTLILTIFLIPSGLVSKDFVISMCMLIIAIDLSYLFEFNNQILTYVKLKLAERLCSLIGLALLILLNIESNISAYSILALGSVLSIVIQAAKNRNIFINRINLANSVQIQVSFVSYSWPLIIGLFVATAYGSVSKLLISQKIPTVAFAYFSLAFQISTLASLIQSHYNRVGRSIILSGKQTIIETKKNTASLFSISLRNNFILTIIVIGISPIAVPLIYGQTYFQATQYFIALSPILITVPLTGLLSIMLLSQGKQTINLCASLTGVSFMVAAILLINNISYPVLYAACIPAAQLFQAFIQIFFLTKNP